MEQSPAGTRIRGKVAQFVSTHEVAITCGRKQGVRPGMCFDIMARPIDIRDPDTGVVLDTISRPKARVEAVDVRENVSICAHYRHVGGQAESAQQSRKELFGEKIAESLLASVAEKREHFDSDYVRIGDVVLAVEEQPGD